MTDTLARKYLADSHDLSAVQPGRSGHLEWKCPSNIALIKYWGKKPVQQPLNPSLSFTLMHSTTTMTVEYRVKEKQDQVTPEFLIENQANPLFAERISTYLQYVAQYLPFLKSMHLTLKSANSFPHSAGIASSASSFGALALALCSIEQELYGTLGNLPDFFRKSSFLARLGSGSACRSVLGGYALWGYSPYVEGSSDEAAVAVSHAINPVFKDLRDSILIVQSGAKTVSSSAGHRLMKDHPFAQARIAQANDNLGDMLKTLSGEDLDLFIEILENEALTLHGLMLSSKPGYILMHPNTIVILNKIRSFRKKSGKPVGFTLDAGANVHVLYPGMIETEVRLFIENELKAYCENGWVIHDLVGNGPLKTGT